MSVQRWGEKPYHSLDYELKKRFGEKIKTTMDANIRTSEMKKNLRALYLKAEEMNKQYRNQKIRKVRL